VERLIDITVESVIDLRGIRTLEANAAQNAIARELLALKEPLTGLHEKVLLHWYQARNEPHTKSGDKAIIPSIASHPVKTVFSNDQIKAVIIFGDDNPFKKAYVVDVLAETIRDRIALYKILAVHEKFEIDEV